MHGFEVENVKNISLPVKIPAISADMNFKFEKCPNIKWVQYQINFHQIGHKHLQN